MVSSAAPAASQSAPATVFMSSRRSTAGSRCSNTFLEDHRLSIPPPALPCRADASDWGVHRTFRVLSNPGSLEDAGDEAHPRLFRDGCDPRLYGSSTLRILPYPARPEAVRGPRALEPPADVTRLHTPLDRISHEP